MSTVDPRHHQPLSTSTSTSASHSTPSNHVSQQRTTTAATHYPTAAAPLSASPPYPLHPPTRPSLVPPYLARLTRLLTLLLAVGGSAALISTMFILPLLQSTFAARSALIKAQSERMEGFVGRLRAMRALKMYGPSGSRSASASGSGSGKVGSGVVGERSAVGKGSHGSAGGRDDGFEEKKDANEREEAMAEHVGEATALVQSEKESESQSQSQSGTPTLPPLLPLSALFTLISTLRALSHTRANTSTTRTSLLSTIEAYTASLHRQLWNPTPGHSTFGLKSGGVGLGSLDRQLALEGKGAGAGAGKSKGKGAGEGHGDGDRYDAAGWNAFEMQQQQSRANKGQGQFEDVMDRTDEWDAVRREVRGVKGLLLGRRTFARPA